MGEQEEAPRPSDEKSDKHVTIRNYGHLCQIHDDHYAYVGPTGASQVGCSDSPIAPSR